jgi:integrase
MTTPTIAPTAPVLAAAVESASAAVVTGPVRLGPVDRCSAEQIITRLDAHARDRGFSEWRRQRALRGGRLIVRWLLEHPGDGWQQRWLAADGDRLEWLDTIFDPHLVAAGRDTNVVGLASLLLIRVVLPSYDMLAAYRSHTLYPEARQSIQPEAFARVVRRATDNGMLARRIDAGLNVLTRILLHTGRDLEQLTGDDFEELRQWQRQRSATSVDGIVPAWDLLRGVEILPKNLTYAASVRPGQRPTPELVDRYQLRCTPVRDLLVRYLEERRPSLDYVSFTQLVSMIVVAFWLDIERHHPEVDSLHLPAEVATAWKERLKYIRRPGKAPQPRKSYLHTLVMVRGFYLDLQQWSLEDPSWAPHAVPSPIRRTDTTGMRKERRKTIATMHQRVRERLPQLPVLVEVAERRRADQRALLALAQATPIGNDFIHGDVRYRRTAYSNRRHGRGRPEVVLVENTVTGDTVDLFATEDEAFWSWATIETLRHTGIRREELLEITHLALVSYRLAGTGEMVPLLQILPSKSNEERLLLVSPELASTLATIITRVRDRNGGIVPMISQYDRHERTFGPMLPHLFQRRRGHRNEVISTATVQNLLNATLAHAGLRDAAGEPLRFTPHDFRRMFATDAVTGGLPVHIAARLLGHEDLATTQAYLAVFQDDLIRSYRVFLNQRRSIRPEVEYREPSDEEWLEFQRHFALRKVELGTCGRPYGTPCNHEHACIRCPMLRVDPHQRNRLIEIIRNLSERIDDAQQNGWLGEKEGLTVSLEAARNKLIALDRTGNNRPAATTDLGIPTISQPRPIKPAR